MAEAALPGDTPCEIEEYRHFGDNGPDMEEDTSLLMCPRCSEEFTAPEADESLYIHTKTWQSTS